MLVTKLVLAAAIALAVCTAATAQTPEGAPLLKALPADGTTIAIYYKQNVYDPADQKIGQIVDLVIKKDGAVPAAIVSVGGFLGIATNVPFTALQATPAERRPHLVLDTNKKALATGGGRLASRFSAAAGGRGGRNENPDGHDVARSAWLYRPKTGVWLEGAPQLPAALRGVNFSEMFGAGCLIGGNADGLGRKASWSARRATPRLPDPCRNTVGDCDQWPDRNGAAAAGEARHRFRPYSHRDA